MEKPKEQKTSITEPRLRIESSFNNDFFISCVSIRITMAWIILQINIDFVLQYTYTIFFENYTFRQ